jgi:hypothetical protein
MRTTQEKDFSEYFYNLSKKDKRLALQAVKEIIASYFTDGALTEADLHLSHEEFLAKVRALSDSSNFISVVDYRHSLLQEANNLYEQKKYELAKIIYAMFFEHTLNGFVYHFSTRGSIDEKTQIDIIRSVDIQGKLTWLLKLLGFPPINEKYRKIIKKLSEERNSFIHYKWKSDRQDNDKDYVQDFKQIKQAVTYMKNYEARILFNKNKTRLASKLKLRLTATNKVLPKAGQTNKQ